MRESQKTMFWRNHRVVELRRNGKVVGWYGCRIPKIFEENCKEVKE